MNGKEVATAEAEVEVGTSRKRYRNVVFDLGGVLLAWDPRAFITHMFSDRQPEAVPLELAHATSLPCWKLLDKGDITREESIALLPASYNKGNLVIYKKMILFPDGNVIV
jgi:FMN phosphatase YigB (HAD superfamily)